MHKQNSTASTLKTSNAQGKQQSIDQAGGRVRVKSLTNRPPLKQLDLGNPRQDPRSNLWLGMGQCQPSTYIDKWWIHSPQLLLLHRWINLLWLVLLCMGQSLQLVSWSLLAKPLVGLLVLPLALVVSLFSQVLYEHGGQNWSFCWEVVI